MKPETAFRKNRVIPFLKTLSHTTAFPIQQIAIRGDPDFILCCHGRFVALELKSRGKRPGPLQQVRLDQVTATGGISLSACPDSWERVKRILTALDGGNFHDQDDL